MTKLIGKIHQVKDKREVKIMKRIMVGLLAAVAAFSLMGCTVEKTVTKTETYTDANGNTITSTTTTDGNGNVMNGTMEITPADASEIITYEFETYDGVQVVIDENNIILQEASDDPQNSEHISADAYNNIIAPGRDFVYLADDDYYYVADISRNLITVADKNQ